MKYLFSTCILLLLVLPSFAQSHVIYMGEKTFASTRPWSLGNQKSGITLTMQVARTENGGFVLLSRPTSFPNQSIRGIVLLYLVDGSVIKCYDKNIKDRVDGESKAVYYLTQKEMEKLSTNRIRSVRYSVGHNDNGIPSNLDEASIVINKIPAYPEEDNAYDDVTREGDKMYITDEEIFKLFL